MTLSDFKVLKWYQDELTSRSRDFYRCYRCGRLFTREWELATMARLARIEADDDTVDICPCGSKRYLPSKPVLLGWLRPSIVKYVYKLVLARGIAPLAERYRPELLPYLDKWSKPDGWLG